MIIRPKEDWIAIGIVTLITILICSNAHALEIDKLANAIYKAEGGENTRHPYGILAKYKTTTPRQACINTINSNLKRFNKDSFTDYEFIEYMSKSYCPIGAKNDPTGLNKNWVKNVWYFYKQEMLT
jgi:hypothetical protein